MSRGTLRQLGLVVLAATFIVSGSAQVADPGQSLFAPPGSVRVRASVDHRTYRAGQKIVVRCELENASDNPIYVSQRVHALLGDPGFEVRFLTRAGSEPRATMSGDPYRIRSVSPVEQVKTDSLLLRPASFLGMKWTIFTDGYLDLKPGSYQVRVTYHSWNSKALGAGELERLKLNSPVLVGDISAPPVWVRIVK